MSQDATSCAPSAATAPCSLQNAARRSGAQLTELVRLDHGLERAAFELEEADDEREPPVDEHVALQPRDTQLAICRSHHREVAALDRKPAAGHELDAAARHAPEAVLDHRHGVRRPGERRDVGLGEVKGHPPSVGP
jgi:hypothetical protein